MLTGHTERVRALAVLPDHRLASGGSDVRLWCTRTHACVAVLTITPSDWVQRLAALPDGRLAATGAEKMVRVWPTHLHHTVGYAAINAAATTMAANKNSILGIAALPDNRLATSGVDGVLRVWQLPPAAASL